ncbi:tripartite tricarboxylate transporter TctB family protein [Alkalihalobacillus oceani]|uniref:tripartite tricarboxylate transporter TctB family protein n=1 Tax=Halalkalibacter oceani TaxID=1653776 RepID=UPI00204231E7|nr:tripartite tricarboxylate transporter TctB family protein [Halalkalibacter oceani]MCM3761844.1 tripartite tricarboxylate transporter TctB family protein [Halalkalibacter oceani]
MVFERVKDIIVSVLIFAVCILFYIHTKDLVPPADIFPKVVILVFSILGFFLLLKAVFMKRAYEEREEQDLEDEEKGSGKRKWISIVGIVVYIVLMPIVGFYVTSGIFLLLLSMFLIGKKPNVKGSVVPVVVSASVMCILYLTFSVFLRVPVPGGALF